MAPLSKLLPHVNVEPVRDPIGRTPLWPGAIVVGLIVAGAISPLICFAGAALAYALADPIRATILTGTGLAHIVLAGV